MASYYMVGEPEVDPVIRARYRDLRRAYSTTNGVEKDAVKVMLEREADPIQLEARILQERKAMSEYFPTEGAEDWQPVAPHMRQRKGNFYFALLSFLFAAAVAIAVFIWIMVCYNHNDWIHQKYVYRTTFATSGPGPHVIEFQYSTGPQNTFSAWAVFAAYGIAPVFIFILGIAGSIILEMSHRFRGTKTAMETRSMFWAPVRYYMDQLIMNEIDFIQFGVQTVVFTLQFFLFQVANARQDILELTFLPLLMPFMACLLNGFVQMSEFSAQNYSQKKKMALLHYSLNEGSVPDIDFYHFVLNVEFAEDVFIAQRFHIFVGFLPHRGDAEHAASKHYLRHFVRSIVFPHALYLFNLCLEFTYATWIFYKYPANERYDFLYAVWVIMYVTRFAMFFNDTIHLSPEGSWKRYFAWLLRAAFYVPFRFVHRGVTKQDETQTHGYLLDDILVRAGVAWLLINSNQIIIPALWFVYTTGVYSIWPYASTYP